MSDVRAPRSGNSPTNEGGSFGVDDSSCGREPIHVPVSAPPHGALIAFDPKSLRIVQAGGDTIRIFDAEPFDLIGENCGSLFPPDRIRLLNRMLNAESLIMRPLHAFTIPSKQDWASVDAFVYRSGDLLMLEFEPTNESEPDDAFTLVQTMLARVDQANATQAFRQGLVDEMRRVSGFDRVMLYRFLPDGGGVVDAELLGNGVESFLGLHYPPSDIPRQARDLYLNNGIRLIPNARYTPAAILPADDPGAGAPLDLGLRGVSPMHLEHLSNIGVIASMSLSIIVGGKLWGLIACHHRTPRFLSHRLRMACELFAQTASAKLETRVSAEQFEAQLKSKRIHEELVTRMSGEPDLAEGLTRYKSSLLDYIPAEGVALWLDNQFIGLGKTPKPEQVASLVAWLNETGGEGVFHTDKLPRLYPPSALFADVASGLIALSVSKTPRDYILWFRPEAIRTVALAGAPNKAVETANKSQRLSPRKSFSACRELVRLHSRPWRSIDVEAAKTLRLSLMEVILRRIDQVAREREEAGARQAALTAELDRRLELWQAAAADLKEEAQRRVLAETELSRALRSAVEAREAERQRIARELHDSLGQTLTLLKLGLDELDDALPDSALFMERLKALKGLANGVGAEVNRLACEIRPTALDDLGLEAAIRHLVETWSERLKLPFDLRLALDDRRLNLTVETTLYRVLQEAITNIARHANASRVAVLLEAREKEVSMIVEDNGRGFSPAEPTPDRSPSKHLGLLGIRERLSLVSGTLEIESSPGTGCTLFIRAPL